VSLALVSNFLPSSWYFIQVGGKIRYRVKFCVNSYWSTAIVWYSHQRLSPNSFQPLIHVS